MLELTIGIDIGGTSTKFGLVDMRGDVLRQNSIPTDNPNVNEFVKELATAIRIELDTVDEPFKLHGIGVGAPNGNFFKGSIEEAPNLPWKGSVPMADLLSEEFEIPAVLANDANAATIGEMVFGGAKDMKDFVVITLGTGLGSGFVVNGQLVRGHDGFAGEVGHVGIKIKGGRKCKCGKTACLETYVSATGLKRTVYKLLADHHVDSELRKYSFEDLDTKIVAQAAENGDELAIEAFEYTGKILGTKLADTVNHTNPEAIFIMGGLAQARDLIFKPTIKALEAHLLTVFKGRVKVLPSKIDNNSAPIVGASSLILDKLYKEKELV